MVVSSALEAARSAAKAAIEGLYYEGTCSVVEFQEVTSLTSRITRHEEVTVLENQPCRLSFESLAAADQTDTAARISLRAKLFIAPDTDIKAGSKVIVTQCGESFEFSYSGESAVYPTHREIMLDLFRGWA